MLIRVSAKAIDVVRPGAWRIPVAYQGGSRYAGPAGTNRARSKVWTLDRNTVTTR